MTAIEAVRLYTVAATADLLGVGKDYVYDRIRAGVIATTELGDDYGRKSGGVRSNQRIRADVLQDFIDSRTFSTERTAA